MQEGSAWSPHLGAGREYVSDCILWPSVSEPSCERHPGSSLKVVNSHPHCQRTGVSGVGLRKTFLTNMSDDSIQMESASSL